MPGDAERQSQHHARRHAGGRLDDGVERSFGAEHRREVEVDARLHHLRTDNATRSASGESLPHLSKYSSR